MRLVLAFLTFAFGASAFAAGYTCLSVDRDLRAVAYLKNGEPTQLVFIDPSLPKKDERVATFRAMNKTLAMSQTKDGVQFVGRVDMSVPTIAKAGRELGGTSIDFLSNVVLAIQTVTKTQQIQLMVDGSMYAAQVSYIEKNGHVLQEDFDCALFLGETAPTP